jgi:hypothetical protein
MELNANDLEIILLPGKNPPKQFLAKYNQAYLCWRQTWEHAFKLEMNHHEVFFSDNFTRQDEVLALFYKGECVGLTFFRGVNFAEKGTCQDSYFEYWPETSVHALCKHGKRIYVISQFTIHMDYRKNYFDLSLRDLLVGLCYERFVNTDYDAGATAVRVQKHMEQAVSKVGATTLASNMPYDFDQKVDLISYFHDKIHESTVPGIAELVNQIYPKTISLVLPLTLRKKEVARVA